MRAETARKASRREGVRLDEAHDERVNTPDAATIARADLMDCHARYSFLGRADRMEKAD